MRYIAPLLLLHLLLTCAIAQPQFGPVRLDPATDRNFFYPTIEIVEGNLVRTTWASQNSSWIGAYGRNVDMNGNVVGAQDTLEVSSAQVVSCPPIVNFYRLSSGAWCKMIYHA